MTNDNLPARLRLPDQPVVTYDPVGPDPDEDGSGFDVGRLFAAVLRFKWLVVFGTILGVAGGAIGWTRTDLEYVARASLWIQGAEGRTGPISGGNLLTASSWIDLLRSYTVLNAVVIDHGLYLTVSDTISSSAFSSFGLEEQFVPGDYEVLYSPAAQSLTLFHDGLVVESKAPGERLGAVVGFSWTPPAEGLAPDTPILFSLALPRVVAAGINRNLEARFDGNGTFIRVALRGKDPPEVATTLNAILDQYVGVAADLKSASLEERTSILSQQLATSEGDLLDAERALQAFRVSTVALPSDAPAPILGGVAGTPGPAFQAYNALRLDIESLDASVAAIERVLADQPDSTLRVESLEMIPAVRTSSQLVTALSELTGSRVELRTLKRRYTDEYREVQDLAAVVRALETETVPSLLRALVQQLREDEERMQDRVDEATLELADIPPRTIEDARLQRRVALSSRIYGDVLGRHQEAELASASTVPDVRVLDQATTPTSPELDTRIRAALLIVFAGLGAGLALAVLLDRVDPRIQYTSDVTDALGMDILGVIPKMASGSDGGDRSARQAVEAFRDLRVNLEFAYGAGKPLAVTLTSPDESEGKSTLVANLATSFGAVGRRTLVIDGDTRKGDLHWMLGASRKPGLTDFLMGDVTLDETVQDTKFPGVHVIGSGSRSQASPELLGSRKLGDLVGELWKRYDVVLVDSPPLGAGADALILGTLTGQIGLVLRTSQTNIGHARARLAALERLPVRILGVILNAFVQRRGQGYYSYYEYIDGYGAKDEPKDPEALLGPVKR